MQFPRFRETIARLKNAIASIQGRLVDNDIGETMPLGALSDPATHPHLSIEARQATISRFERLVRARRQTVYLGNREIMCRVLGRYWLFLNGGDGYLTHHVLANGYWELSCTEYINAEVKPGMRAIDAGANVGYFSVLMGELVGDAGHVYLFEPTPRLKDPLERSMFLNGYVNRTTLITDPLWDTVGAEVTFAIPNADTKNARISDPVGGDDHTQVTLTTTTIDATIQPGEKIDFIKVDVEGAELQLWRGMKRVLSENEAISVFLEYNAGRGDAATLLDEIEDAGFALAYLDSWYGVKPVSREELMTKNVGEDWMLCLKRPSRIAENLE